ncbi:acetylcholine-gated ion channel acc-4-like isoform X2 [Gigantopelta aegis]|uniref:acetylcholine-gated ion channel acc-4-like isoform X2 n=1 Tax=Gigantopelta aegis TaxID=1735272 RepID=UPI001B887918|nr:acetylcholine-gated ion channel acc-4-like isoform X2 [Gigantopelta aegis]
MASDLADALRDLLSSLSSNNHALKQLILVADDLEKTMSEEGIREIIERDDRVIVEVKCTFQKIGDVDTVTQEFEAEGFIQSKWEEPLLDHIQEKNIQSFDANKFWDPQLVILNVIGDLYQDHKSYTVRLHEPGYDHALIIQFWRFKGKFQEYFELEHFPFDVQDLTIQLSSDRRTEQIHIIEDEQELSAVNINMFLDCQEWSIYEHVELIQDISTREFSRHIDHSVLHILIRVRRKSGCYLWNVVFIMFMIKLLTFATWGINPDIPDRVMLIATLFLTAVTFKFVVSSSLPVISYLTYLDKYILLSLVFLLLQSIESASVSELTKIYDMDTVVEYDLYAMGGLLLLLIVFHVGFAIYIHKTALRKRRLMKKKDRLYASIRNKRQLQKKFNQRVNMEQVQKYKRL